MSTPLTHEEKQTLLRLARQALDCAVHEKKLPPLDSATLTATLRAFGASFITLTVHGQLRGCIGALEPYQSLAEDVREHTLAAALQDFRFEPVRADELDLINIEVSRLTTPRQLDYTDAEDLLNKLHPGVDGVTLMESRYRRATFLPQVWEKIPNKEDFLGQLCMKMGTAPDTWRRKHLDVQVYQVEEFHE